MDMCIYVMHFLWNSSTNPGFSIHSSGGNFCGVGSGGTVVKFGSIDKAKRSLYGTHSVYVQRVFNLMLLIFRKNQRNVLVKKMNTVKATPEGKYYSG